MKYENEICQGCGKRFEETDDVVVCPECGTPQHRECYNRENRCVNEHLHSDGYEWQPRHSERNTENERTAPDRQESRICPMCGHRNSPDATACENCGQPFELFGRSIFPENQQKRDYEAHDNGRDYNYRPPFHIDGEPPVDESFSTDGNNQQSFVYQGAVLDGEIQGVDTRDIALYLRTNVKKYFNKFKRLEKGKPTFNFAALFLGPYWFFYRKLFKPGIIFLTLAVCLSIGFSSPMNKMAEDMQSMYSGIEYDDEGNITEASLQKMTDNYVSFMEEYLPTVAIYGSIMLVLRLIMALVADRLYRKKVIGDIKRINDGCGGDSEAKYLQYLKSGSTSLMFLFSAYMAQYLITLLFAAFFT